MRHQFNIQQLYALPTLYLCFVFISEQTATCAIGFYNPDEVFTARYGLGL